MNYKKLLEDGYEQIKIFQQDPDLTRAEYLCDHIFEIVTYDGEMAAMFGEKAVEVCNAILTGKTFEYIEDKERYKWYLTMCNFPFFKNKIEWGCSIRGAWWMTYQTIKYTSCGMFDGREQVLNFEFKENQWKEFIEAITEFSAGDISSSTKDNHE